MKGGIEVPLGHFVRVAQKRKGLGLTIADMCARMRIPLGQWEHAMQGRLCYKATAEAFKKEADGVELKDEVVH